jgi:hypothetical protein
MLTSTTSRSPVTRGRLETTHTLDLPEGNRTTDLVIVSFDGLSNTPTLLRQPAPHYQAQS